MGITKIDGGVTAPKGFSVAHTGAGIKYTGRDDMAMILSDTDCTAAGVFTRNVVKAAPVLFDRQQIDTSDAIRAIVVNAGIANACTGQQGLNVCKETAELTSKYFNVPADSVLVASTGVIGFQLPIERIEVGLTQMQNGLSTTREEANLAAKAIMTTDTHEKEAAFTFELDGQTVTVAGMTKGAGMIHPNMGTMLCFLTTDAAVKKELLDQAIRDAVDDTFNMISVDGDTSTNDTCVVIANGNAGNTEIAEKNEAYELFFEALHSVCQDLAMQMAGDGEGATTLLEAHVIHAPSIAEGRVLAKSVITSNLTKAAIFGRDANWGRILCALGYSGVQFDPEKVDLYFRSDNGEIKIIEDSVALDYSEEEAKKILTAPKVTVTCDMKAGDAEATAWGCDLTFDYVKINADYRS